MFPESILQAEHISFTYQTQTALDDISFSVPRGCFCSIIGQNGSGKSTLLQILCGNRKPKKGTVLLEGKPLLHMSIQEKAHQLAIIHQQQATSFPFRCIEVVAMGLHPHLSRFESKNKYREEIEHSMELTDTLPLANKLITQISGGEAQRILLARALVQKPTVLMLDEAMSELDINARIKMHKMLKKRIEETSFTVISVNHDIHTAFQYSDYLLALKNGKLEASGTPTELITSDFFSDIFEVQVEIAEKGFYIYDEI